ncbi:MAG: ComF family protein [Hyphomicrobiaceae bacterium]
MSAEVVVTGSNVEHAAPGLPDTAGQRPPRPRLAANLARLARVAARPLQRLIVPAACPACRTPLAEPDALCAPCWSSVRFIVAPLCDRTGRPLPFQVDGPVVSAAALADPPDYDHARAVGLHQGALRTLVLDFKYRDRQDARRLLGRLMEQAGRDLIAEADVIAPVPMPTLRLVQRHFNQSALLAGELGRRTRLPVWYALLKRVRSTPRQVELSGAARRNAPRGSVAVAKHLRSRIKGQSVLLIDDVITTGATVSACARALRAAGVRRVDVLAVTLSIGDTDTSALDLL